MTSRAQALGPLFAPPEPVARPVLAVPRSEGDAPGREACRWAAAILDQLGPELGAWPSVTRELFVDVVGRMELDAAARLWARVEPGGGQGGGSPLPYPDSGHLLVSADQDGGFSRSAASGGMPEGAARGPGAGARESLTQLADRVARELAPATGTGDVSDPLATAPGVDGGALLRALARVGVAMPPENRTPWLKRQHAWELENAVRAAIEAATGRPIRDKLGDVATCRTDGWVYQHQDVHTAFQFRAHTCKVRGRCPHCGKTYGHDQADELHSLLMAALAPCPPGGNQALGWGVVLTMPPEVTRRLAELATDLGRIKELRPELRKAVAVAKEYLAALFAREGLDPKRLGAAVNVHWWSSRNPLTGWHWHLHIMVPNATADGEPVRDAMKFSQQRLDGAREVLRAALHRTWGDLLKPDRQANVKVRFFPNTKKGRRRWRHRTRYDARHPFADLLKLAHKLGPAVLADEKLAELRTFAHRVEDLQRLKTRRYVGFLVPGRRKDAGLRKAEKGKDQWRPIEGGYRRIIRYTDRGLVLRRHDRDGEVHTEVLGELVTFESTAPPDRWTHTCQEDSTAEHDGEETAS